MRKGGDILSIHITLIITRGHLDRKYNQTNLRLTVLWSYLMGLFHQKAKRSNWNQQR